MFTFDGANKLITVGLNVTAFTTTELYSDWKDWVLLSDNAKYLPALISIGNEPISASNNSPAFLFLANGWRIAPFDGEHTLIVTGNIAVEGGVGSPFIVNGDCAVQIQTNTSFSPAVAVGNGGGNVSIYPRIEIL